MSLRLWKYSRITGLWSVERSVTPETAARWLAIFQKDEPRETFVISKRRPLYAHQRKTPIGRDPRVSRINRNQAQCLALIARGDYHKVPVGLKVGLEKRGLIAHLGKRLTSKGNQTLAAYVRAEGDPWGMTERRAIRTRRDEVSPRKCRVCGARVNSQGRGDHYSGCRNERKRAKAKGPFGVYPHAFWAHDHVEINFGGGYVVREVGGGVPYSRMHPLRIFVRKHDADRFADKLTFERDTRRHRRKRS